MFSLQQNQRTRVKNRFCSEVGRVMGGCGENKKSKKTHNWYKWVLRWLHKRFFIKLTVS
jgi:hypothetical protein